MKATTPFFRQALWLSSFVTLALLVVACSTLDRIGDRQAATNTFEAPRTATFGGRISVWMVSPTGQLNADASGTRPSVNSGDIVGPVGTATAISQTLIAATQTAAVPIGAPSFGTSDCPLAGGRSFGPAPDDFAQFPESIGAYLSNGGSTRVLESGLGG